MTPEDVKLERRLSPFAPFSYVRRGDIFYAENGEMSFAFVPTADPNRYGEIVWVKDKQGKEIACELISPAALKPWEKRRK